MKKILPKRLLLTSLLIIPMSLGLLSTTSSTSQQVVSQSASEGVDQNFVSTDKYVDTIEELEKYYGISAGEEFALSIIADNPYTPAVDVNRIFFEQTVLATPSSSWTSTIILSSSIPTNPSLIQTFWVEPATLTGPNSTKITGFKLKTKAKVATPSPDSSASEFNVGDVLTVTIGDAFGPSAGTGYQMSAFDDGYFGLTKHSESVFNIHLPTNSIVFATVNYDAGVPKSTTYYTVNNTTIEAGWTGSKKYTLAVTPSATAPTTPTSAASFLFYASGSSTSDMTWIIVGSIGWAIAAIAAIGWIVSFRNSRKEVRTEKKD